MLLHLSTEVKQTWKQYSLKQCSSAYINSEICSGVLQRISNGLSTPSRANMKKMIGIVLHVKKH